MRSFGLLIAVPFLFGACTLENEFVDDDAGASDDELVGGRPALDSEFTATVSIGVCTAAKVGPRHFLTAAHCVDGDNGAPDFPFTPGFFFSLTPDNEAQILTHSVSVAQTHVFPLWTSTCVSPCSINILNPSHPPDVAVIVVNETTPDIPQASIDATPVAVGGSVVMTGYGCENGLNQPSPGVPRFKLETVSALPGSALLHPGSFVAPGDVNDIVGSNVITPGMAANSDAASLCFGDSGGPLYRNSATEQLVVGVNAYYTFPDGNGISSTNWHTRLDSAARYGVLSWLQGLGVNISGATTPGPGSTPFHGSPAPLPGRLQAEDYDLGGENVAFRDTTSGNSGGQYRSDRVDIQTTTDAGGGFNITNTAATEWLQYSVTAATAGNYDLNLRIATTGSSKKLHVEIDGQNVTGSITLPSTGGGQRFRTVTVNDRAIAAGPHRLRVVFETNGINLNWVDLAL